MLSSKNFLLNVLNTDNLNQPIMNRKYDANLFNLNTYLNNSPNVNLEHIPITPFTNFFKIYNLDIPKCFVNSKSLLRPSYNFYFLRLNNFFMRQGKRYKSYRLFNKALWNFKHYSHLKFINLEKSDDLTMLNLEWKVFYLNLVSISYNTQYNKYEHTPILPSSKISYENLFTFPQKNITNSWYPKKWFFSKIKSLEPVFSFYIYKVDKKIFKNTRGKSGKYTFIWKYIPFYKRRLLVMFWLMRELKVQSGRSIVDRLTKLIELVILNFKSTWIWRIRNFSHNYVYKNSLKTLGNNYISVKK